MSFQTLQGPPGSGRGLVLAASFVAAPDQSINTMPYFAAVGGVYRGLPASPRQGRAGLRRLLWRVQPRSAGADLEAVLELTYSLVVSPWLTVQPDIQYVINLGGRSSVKNTLVIGAQISITF
jgi:hypothetical protein